MESDSHPKQRECEPPLIPALLLTWLNSIGTSIAWAGVFFVAHVQYDFGNRENLMLAVLGGYDIRRQRILFRKHLAPA